MCQSGGVQEAQVVIGGALFNAPMLLGGQAARADISCASCHSNGRRSAHFFLTGVSSQPGTADVSSSFFSPVRANGKFDPKPIPDLALPGKVSRDPATGELERFLRGLIVEEFAGREPSRQAIGALAAYVRSIGQCGSLQEQQRSLSDQIRLVRQSVQAAVAMVRLGDTESAAVLVSGARHQLGLIDERYAGQALRRQRQLLLASSRDLQPAATAGSPDPEHLLRWKAGFERNVAPMLIRTQSRSLYNPARLADWLRLH